MFLFLVDGNRTLDDPTDRTHAGLFRGFILRNSDVGALTLDLFLFRMVCGNHIIWGFQPWPASGAGTGARRFRTRGLHR